MRRGANKYGARKTQCNAGVTHASGAEAARCNQLLLLEKAGQISRLEHHPVYRFVINGRAVKMGNGQVARITLDWRYFENNEAVVEEYKGAIARDFPLRIALFKALYPGVAYKQTGKR